MKFKNSQLIDLPMKIPKLYYLLLVLAFQSSLLAQESHPERTVSIRCLSFLRGSEHSEMYAHSKFAPKETSGLRVKFKGYLNHERFVLPISGEKIVLSESANRESGFTKVYAEARIPRSVDKVLLVLFAGKKGGAPYRVMVLDDSVENFPRGAIQCINLSKESIRLNLGGEVHMLKPSQKKSIVDPPIDESGHSSMYAHIYENKQWRRVGASLWPHPGSKRIYQFFYSRGVNGAICMKGVKDISPE